MRERLISTQAPTMTIPPDKVIDENFFMAGIDQEIFGEPIICRKMS